MRFPREKLVLFSLRAEFVDLDELLHFAKKHRAFKRSYYVIIDYPDSFDILLVRQGELTNIVRVANNVPNKEISLKDVENKIKHTDSSLVNVAFADDQLLAMMTVGLRDENVIREVNARSTPALNLLRDLSVQNFSGILVITRSNEKSYVLVKEGEVSTVYLAPGGRTPDDLLKYLRECDSELSIKIIREVPEEAAYATSAQVELLMTSANRLLEEFTAILGRNIVKKIAEISIKGVAKEHTFFEGLEITDDARFTGEPKVDPDSLVKGFAAFFNLLADSLSTISGGRHITVFRKALQDYRFALNNLKFFDHIKEQIF
ncbi:MAG: hypothetical protein U9Q76_08570 [candidate division WOR-3 bacterium]|nr:hypothetical protein [candidate division WOR-3 bacterium]